MLMEKWKEHNEKIDSMGLNNINDILKSEVLDKFILFPIESNNGLMKWELEVLRTYLVIKNDFNILEIGAGIGNFCKTLQDGFNVASYTILDTPSMLRVSKFFLDYYKVPYTAVENSDDLFGKKFDLCVSNLCMSELSDEYIDGLLKNVLINCRYVFIIDTVRPEFAEVFGKKLVRYSKFRNVKGAKCEEFYLPNHGVIFASRGR